MVFSTSVCAQIYRCTDAAGNVSYSEAPCATQQKAKELNLEQEGQTEPEVCNELSFVANKIYPMIRGRKDMDKVFESLERKSPLTKPMRRVVNYLASYRFIKSLYKNRVMMMTKDRCLRGGFGVITLQDLPEEYTRSGSGRDFNEVIKRQQEQRQQAKQRQLQQVKQICEKYKNILKIYDKRLSVPMDEIERAKLQAERDMTQSIKDENCQKSDQ